MLLIIAFALRREKKFPSFAEAGRQKGVDKASIQRVISGKQNTAGGFHWIKEIKQ